MKRILVSAVAVAILVGYLGKTWSQNATAKSPAKTIPHKIGLIDMAKVFKEYEKFGTLRAALKADIQDSDREAKTMALQSQQLREQMKMLKPGTSNFIDLEKQLTDLTSKFEAFRKNAQRDFLRKEAQIYRTIYLEVAAVVRQAAEAWNYTLIIRFNSEDLDGTDPQKLIQGLNRQVVYHRTDDDITDSVLDYLNRKYEERPSVRKSSPTRTGQNPRNNTRKN